MRHIKYALAAGTLAFGLLCSGCGPAGAGDSPEIPSKAPATAAPGFSFNEPGRDGGAESEAPAGSAAIGTDTAGGISAEAGIRTPESTAVPEGTATGGIMGGSGEDPDAGNPERTGFLSRQALNAELPEGRHADGRAGLGIGDYAGSAWEAVNGNVPLFGLEEEPQAGERSYVLYDRLDSRGRCGTVLAMLGPDMERGTGFDPGSMKPTGWQYTEYPGIGNLYDARDMLPGDLGGNGTMENRITATKYMSSEGIAPFEALILDHMANTGDTVLYRITPVFENNEGLARGVLLEAKSFGDGLPEDPEPGQEPERLEFCVFCHNVQPGAAIDYSDGASRPEDADMADDAFYGNRTYITDAATGLYHKPGCAKVLGILYKHRDVYHGTERGLGEERYAPCPACLNTSPYYDPKEAKR